MNGGSGAPKYALVDDTKYLHSMNEDNKFSSPVIQCHQMTVDDQSIMKSSPNSQPTLSQLTTANLHMEDGIKNEDTNYAISYMH